MELDVDLYEFERSLGRGSFGVVFLIKRKDDGKQFAVKRIDFDQGNEREEATKEAHLLSKLEHRNVLTYIESFEDDDCINIVTEYCEGGDLDVYLRKRNKHALHEKHIIFWVYQVTCGLQYLHRNKILHRDMKTKNIFLDGHLNLKLGDLGIAKVLSTCQTKAETFVGTIAYMAPELIDHQPYGYKADIWSLGCCTFEMILLSRAFPCQAMFVVVKDIKAGKLPDFPDKFSKELSDITHRMLRQHPGERPSCDELLSNFPLKAAEKWSVHGVISPDVPAELKTSEKPRESQSVRNMLMSTSWKTVKKQIDENEKKKFDNSLKKLSKLNGSAGRESYTDETLRQLDDESDGTFVIHSVTETVKHESSHKTEEHKQHDKSVKKSKRKVHSPKSAGKKPDLLAMTLPIGTDLQDLIKADKQTLLIQHLQKSKRKLGEKVTNGKTVKEAEKKECEPVFDKESSIGEEDLSHLSKLDNGGAIISQHDPGGAIISQHDPGGAIGIGAKKKVKKKGLLTKVAERKKSGSGAEQLSTPVVEKEVQQAVSPRSSIEGETVDDDDISKSSDFEEMPSKSYVPFEKKKTTESIRGIMGFISQPENREIVAEQAKLLQEEMAQDIGQDMLSQCYDAIECIQDDNVLKAVLQELIGKTNYDKYQMHLFFLRMYEVSIASSDC